MGEVVAALFLLMFIFGLSSFAFILCVSFFTPRIDAKVSLALLGFAASGATGFAATWRFMVLSKQRETPIPGEALSIPNAAKEENDFFDQHGYFPMKHEPRDRGSGKWGL